MKSGLNMTEATQAMKHPVPTALCLEDRIDAIGNVTECIRFKLFGEEVEVKQEEKISHKIEQLFYKTDMILAILQRIEANVDLL